MISKNMIKEVRALEMKKNRKRTSLFVAEGPKVVGDMLGRFGLHALIATDEWRDGHGGEIQKMGDAARWTDDAWGVVPVSDDELRRISFLMHPQQVVALFKIPEENGITAIDPLKELVVALDGVQDPGNLGTIIRIADWFGITTIICSLDTADVYNPKVVQATMGSIARVKVAYTDLAQYLSALPSGTPVFATELNGENIYERELPQHGIIIMGNEGNGISNEVKALVSDRLLIPTFATTADKADSLNVAVATAIVCSEFKRKSAIGTNK